MNRSGLILFPCYSLYGVRTSNMLGEATSCHCNEANPRTTMFSCGEFLENPPLASVHQPSCPRCLTHFNEITNWCANCGELLLGHSCCTDNPSEFNPCESYTESSEFFKQQRLGMLAPSTKQESVQSNVFDYSSYAVPTTNFMDPIAMHFIDDKTLAFNDTEHFPVIAQERNQSLHVAESTLPTFPHVETLQDNGDYHWLASKPSVTVGSLQYVIATSNETTGTVIPAFKIRATSIASSHPDSLTLSETDDVRHGSSESVFNSFQLSYAMHQMNLGRQRCISGPVAGKYLPNNVDYPQKTWCLDNSPLMCHSSDASSLQVYPNTSNLQDSVTCLPITACEPLPNRSQFLSHHGNPSSFLDDFFVSNDSQPKTYGTFMSTYSNAPSKQALSLEKEFIPVDHQLKKSTSNDDDFNLMTGNGVVLPNIFTPRVRSYSSELNLRHQAMSQTHPQSSDINNQYWQSRRSFWLAKNPCLSKRSNGYVRSRSRKPNIRTSIYKRTSVQNQDFSSNPNPSELSSQVGTPPSFRESIVSTTPRYGHRKPLLKQGVGSGNKSSRKSSHSYALSSHSVESPPPEVSHTVQPETVRETEEKGEDHPDWLLLPDELWLTVLRLLPMCDKLHAAFVCRRMALLVSEKSVWPVIHLHRFRSLTDGSLASIARLQPSELKLCYCRGEKISAEGLQKLFQACSLRLRKFSLIGCLKGPFDENVPMRLIGEHCPNLSSVNLSYSPAISDQAVIRLVNSVKRLVSVKLNGAQNITNSAIRELVRLHKYSLERLELFGCFKLTSEILLILEDCKQLRVLAFGHLHRLPSGRLLELVGKLPHLISLDLRGTKTLAKGASTSQLAIQCPQLEEVVLANMQSFKDEIGLITMLRSLPRLRVLDLCGLQAVGDLTVETLASRCPLLEQLDLSATSVTGRGLAFLSKYPATNLRCLRISRCREIRREILMKVVQACPNLTTIHAYGCSPLMDWAFLLELRPNLSVLVNTV